MMKELAKVSPTLSGDKRNDHVPMLEGVLRGGIPAEGEHQGEGDRLPHQGVRQGDQRLAQTKAHPSGFNTNVLQYFGPIGEFLAGLEKAQAGAGHEKYR